jgi:3-oxoacyl-[acyl-carrier protein] reductase
VTTKGVALITAAGGAGIGRACAREFALRGCTTIATDIHARRVEETARELREETGAQVYGLPMDVADEEAVAAVFDKVQAEIGLVTMLVNNSGVTELAPVENLELSQWRRVIDVCLTGAFLCTRAAVSHMREAGGGVVVNIASVAAWTPSADGESAYAAAKAGVLGFTKATAVELAPAGIRVVGVSPGLVYNPFLAKHYDDDWFARYVERIPIGRAGNPDDIAAIVFDLTTERWAYMTGEVVNVSGGSYLRA